MKERDNTIQRCISNFGPLTREQLMVLAEREKGLGAACTLWRRLLPSKPLISSKRVYIRKGARNEKCVYASYDITKRKDFEHDLITSWVHITLHRCFNLIFWKRGKEKYSGKLNEDAYFILRNPNELVKDKTTGKERPSENHYYLESDTGSEGYTQIEDKLERYIAYFEKDRKAFRVLFVCATDQRAKDLARRASRVIPKERKKLYLFTSLAAFQENPKGQICHVAHSEEQVSILPKLYN